MLAELHVSELLALIGLVSFAASAGATVLVMRIEIRFIWRELRAINRHVGREAGDGVL